MSVIKAQLSYEYGRERATRKYANERLASVARFFRNVAICGFHITNLIKTQTVVYFSWVYKF